MNMYEIITKTKHGQKLTNEEIKWLVDGYVSGEIPDYQVSAWLMAVNLMSLSDEETLCLTMAMKDSGETVDLSTIKNVTVDKHRRSWRQDQCDYRTYSRLLWCKCPKNVRKRTGAYRGNDR